MKEENIKLAKTFDANWAKISSLFEETSETTEYIRNRSRNKMLKSKVKDCEGVRAKKIIAGHIKDTSDIIYLKRREDTDPKIEEKILDILDNSKNSTE